MDILWINLVVKNNTFDYAHHWWRAADIKIRFTVQCIDFDALQIILRYRPCMALLKLGDKYSVSRLEAACQRALTYTPRPGFKSIQSILATGQDKLRQDDSPEQKQTDDHGFTRGSSYYGRDE